MAYLGTQVDIWVAHKDVAFAVLIVNTFAAGRDHWIHHRQSSQIRWILVARFSLWI